MDRVTVYRAATTVSVFAAGAALLAAIWAPGQWWQWLLTAAVLFVVGAAFSNAGDIAAAGRPCGAVSPQGWPCVLHAHPDSPNKHYFVREPHGQ